MRAPRERSRTLVRLVPCVWTVAAVPPDTFCFAAVPLWRCPLLPCWLMPELPCWLPELPCCLAPVLEPDCMPESCACALETASRISRHWGGDSENCRGPEHHCEYSHFFLLRRASPQDNLAADVGFPRAAKIMDERMFILWARGRAAASRPSSRPLRSLPYLAPLHACHLLQDCADRRGVVRGVSAAHRPLVDRHGRVEHWRRAAERMRELTDDRQVLLPDGYFHAGVVVTVSYHHRRPQFEHARIGRARSNHIEHRLRVEPGLEPKHHRLGAGDVVDGDEKIGDIFHAAAVAERAEVVRRTREGRKQRTQGADRLALAARIDHQIFRLRLCARAAHGAVEQHVAGFAQRALGPELIVDGKGAGFDDDARRHVCLDDRRYRRVECGGLRQAGDDRLDLGRERLRIGHDFDACARHGTAAVRVDIVTDYAPSGCNEIARERASHDAQPDDADFAFRHGPSPLPIEAGGRYTAASAAFKRNVSSPATPQDGRVETSVRRHVRCESGSLGSAKWARRSRFVLSKSATRSRSGTAPPR